MIATVSTAALGGVINISNIVQMLVYLLLWTQCFNKSILQPLFRCFFLIHYAWWVYKNRSVEMCDKNSNYTKKRFKHLNKVESVIDSSQSYSVNNINYAKKRFKHMNTIGYVNDFSQS